MKGWKALQNCSGIVDGGLFLNLTALLKDKVKPSAELKSQSISIATEALEEVRTNFHE